MINICFIYNIFAFIPNKQILLFYVFIVEELKKKWKHLRDNYTRDINETRKIQSGSEARNTKRYTYSDILSFLQPVVKKRK